MKWYDLPRKLQHVLQIFARFSVGLDGYLVYFVVTLCVCVCVRAVRYADGDVMF